MPEDERRKRADDLSNSIIQLINQMRDVADGLYRHSYDIETEIPQINKAVISSIEKTVNTIKGELLVSDELVKYTQNKDSDVNVLLEYIKEKEEEMSELTNKAKGKSKYFKMFYNGIIKKEE
ncbi:hypothetical protein NEMIN01_1764 [Nematocida minor]|uniref:uncharacterized protein n=1 Tax=Nematocida minor TaxID=1912983 RepID=UPI00221F596B|nr:uncharacterized protein NEMIN01_1764 [Nematocida minor]KAI5191980.1 hypothetical protein NEMIN01_1764 [Nematocida minor]